MDPDAYLAACRRLAATIIKQADSDRQQQKNNDNMLGEELAENFRNLDEWITKGGRLPKDWRGT